MPEPLEPAFYRDLVARALAEDVGSGDVTTSAIVPAGALARAVLVAKSDAVLAGLDVFREVFAQVDAGVACALQRADGDGVRAGDEIGRLEGAAASILAGERTALNFLQYLSGIATLTRAFVGAAAGRIAILDTRKTTPLFRALAKYAVRCGGGSNHRVGLHDAVLIKDNHIRVAGGIGEAVRRARVARPGWPVEVETQSPAEVNAALAAGADVIMLDNLDDAAVSEAVGRIGGRARVELSGGMTIDRVRRLAASGADSISIGALTHSAPAADISLEITVDVRPAAR